MFEKLKQKWKVNGVGLALILTTFALGGSFCGFLGRKILSFLNINRNEDWYFWPVYLILVTLLWPICVLLTSIFTGQFSFFKAYIKKIGARLFGKKR